MMIIFLNSKCRPLSVYVHVLHDTTVHITCETVSKRKRERTNKVENKYYQVC